MAERLSVLLKELEVLGYNSSGPLGFRLTHDFCFPSESEGKVADPQMRAEICLCPQCFSELRYGMRGGEFSITFFECVL